ncbi:MAG: hypothetical protein AB8G05_16210 [Oligoflexales bacterium]
MKLVTCLIAMHSCFFLTCTKLSAECIGNIQGLLEIKINSCTTIKPLEYFSKPDTVPHEFYEHYDQETVTNSLGSHSGSLVSGMVIGSKAIDTTLNDRAALLGQEIQVFIKKEYGQCETEIFMKKKLLGRIRSICCNGVITAPCLLPTNYLLKPIKAANAQKVKSRAKSASSSAANSDVLEAREQFEEKQYRPSIRAYIAAINKGIFLEPTDSYLLGLSLYLDGQQCSQAIPHLEKVRAKANKLSGDLIADYMKRAMLLLARCYAIERDSDRSALVLGEMLADSENFTKELEIAIYHEDFGWIKTTAEYRSFLEKARSLTKVPLPKSVE